jgi:two-component system chemotaxis sensor kinase CheA
MESHALRVEAWKHERVASRFGRLAEQAQTLARRLGRGDIAVRVDDGGVRLPRESFAPFWAAFVHALRNAIDHGLETPEERAATGKATPGTLSLTAEECGADVVLSIQDDGRGIDWAAVAKAATRRGLPSATRADLDAALFADGLSTQSEATEVSGRGVGMSALHHACRRLGGTIEIDSARGRGTTMSFRFPREARASVPQQQAA